jgi:chemotaxis protein MotB
VSGSEEGKAHELVIIRRRANSDEGGHHGGVWKIAYADFMTAMMAFFLVMWLINSTDKKTLTQVATYFNPMRLTDKKPTPKGLHEPNGTEGNGSAASAGAKAKDTKAKGATKRDEAELGEVRPRGHPFQSGQEARDQGPRSGAGGETDEGVRQTTGRAYRDPFDHVAGSDITPGDPPVGAAGSAQAPLAPPPPPPPEVAAQPAREAAPPSAAEVPPVAAKDAPRDAAKEGAKETAVAQPIAEAVRPLPKEATDDAAKEAEKEAAERADAQRLEADIKKAVAEALPGTIPHIDVRVVPDGVLISLTDDYDFGMFAIASAEPRPAMIVVMDKVARLLLGRPEQLVIRGHTDRRPYRTASYDNWRLSSARAHMAYLMLARSGVEERRFDRIEGYADRSLKIADDPQAAQNRRIEILLRKRTP